METHSYTTSDNTQDACPPLTTNILKDWFLRFNDAYFHGELPLPRLAVSHARKLLGFLSYKRKLRWGHMEASDYCIHVSDYYIRTKRDYQNVMLHEMIHYHIAWHRLPDTSAHGPRFRHIMHTLNERYGWNISISEHTTGLKPRTEEPPRERLVLAMRLTGKRQAVSAVNPNYYQTVNRQIRLIPEITSHAWYTSSDPFFRNLPATRSLRKVHLLTAGEFDRLHEQMRPYPARP